jgi:hypothetical protein
MQIKNYRSKIENINICNTPFGKGELIKDYYSVLYFNHFELIFKIKWMLTKIRILSKTSLKLNKSRNRASFFEQVVKTIEGPNHG